MSYHTRRHRGPVKFRRVCQCCEQEIEKTEPTRFNHLYTLLCQACFRRHLIVTVVVPETCPVQG